MNLKQWLSRLRPQPADPEDQKLVEMLSQWQRDSEAARIARAPKPLDELRACTVFAVLDGGILVVACSGGRDSVALLRAAHELLASEQFQSAFRIPPRLICWHFDHRLRDNSHADADFCEALCRRLGIEFHKDQLTDEQYWIADRYMPEEFARDRRYDALKRFVNRTEHKLGLPVRALTAHHLEDQAATVLFNLTRGTHIDGLRGIAPELQGYLYRPWLRLPREQIVLYLRGLGQDWVTDPTNSDTRYSRNRITMNVLPELLKINPAATQHIARLSRIAQDFSRHIDSLLDSLPEASRDADDLFPRLPLLSVPAMSYRAFYRSKGWRGETLLTEFMFSQLVELGAREDRYLQEWLLSWDKQDEQWFRRGKLRSGEVLPGLLIIEGIGESLVESHNLIFRISPGSGNQLNEQLARRQDASLKIRNWYGFVLDLLANGAELPENYSCFLPADTPQPLRLRAVQAGDRITLTNGHRRKLGDIFTDAKIPRFLRPCWAVLVDASDSVLWLPGLADSLAMARARESAELLRVELRRPSL